MPLRWRWSRWTWTILSRIGASPVLAGRMSCLSASILEAAGKVGLDGVLVAEAGCEGAAGEGGSW